MDQRDGTAACRMGQAGYPEMAQGAARGGQTRRTEGGGNVTRAALSIIGIWIGLPMTGSLLDGGQTWAGIIAGLASLILIAGGVMTEDGDADA